MQVSEASRRIRILSSHFLVFLSILLLEFRYLIGPMIMSCRLLCYKFTRNERFHYLRNGTINDSQAIKPIYKTPTSRKSSYASEQLSERAWIFSFFLLTFQNSAPLPFLFHFNHDDPDVTNEIDNINKLSFGTFVANYSNLSSTLCVM